MNFKSNKLPSTSKDIEWYWSKCVKEDVNFSNIIIDNKSVDFTNPVDFFDLTDNGADKISYIGRGVDFFFTKYCIKGIWTRDIWKYIHRYSNRSIA